MSYVGIDLELERRFLGGVCKQLDADVRRRKSGQYPAAGDTAIVPAGTVVTDADPKFVGNTIDIGGTAGAAALILSGDTFTTFGTPTADGTTVIASAVPGQTSPEVSVLDTSGTFINEGTILADGPAGSVFTVDMAPTLAGTTTLPGYFFNSARSRPRPPTRWSSMSAPSRTC